jgi:1,4-alpha-glucan branching enzyme
VSLTEDLPEETPVVEETETLLTMAPARGYSCLVLHAHLPFVRHPEHKFFLEEQWFYEAMIETYIPLLENMQGWEQDGIHWRLTMSLTPPLLEMMRDDLLKQRFEDHLSKMEELVDKELVRTKDRPEFFAVAEFYQTRLAACRSIWEHWDWELSKAFAFYAATGKLVIMTCGATHGFLPYLADVPGSVRAQIEIACRAHEEGLGQRPKGIWLPECAYLPENDRFLVESGIEFCFNDTHGLLHANPRPKLGVYAPLKSQGGVQVFARDIESSRQVWSKEIGYPGDPNYREFYRDVGYDLDLEYIKPYIHTDLEIRLNTGIKYHAVTGDVDLADKDIYEPEVAADRAKVHGKDFIRNRCMQVAWLREHMDRPPIVVSPYDAELFGHWWYEGPQFVNHLMRAMNEDLEDVAPTHPVEYLENYPDSQEADLGFSTWGAQGYGEVWLNGTNDWIYRHLRGAARTMERLARQYQGTTDQWRRRVLNQMGRELVLAQASDWAFIMNAQTAVEYANKRTRVHLHRLHKMADWLEAGQPDDVLLVEYEAKDNIFKNTMDFALFI